nr:MAG TPA: hypothetical protein [Caudoviricetes sp.]
MGRAFSCILPAMDKIATHSCRADRSKNSERKRY